MTLLALAIIRRDVVAAQAVLRSLHGWYIYENSTAPFDGHSLTQLVPSRTGGGSFRRHLGIEDVPDELLERMPVRAIKAIAGLSRRVSDEKNYTWITRRTTSRSVEVALSVSSSSPSPAFF